MSSRIETDRLPPVFGRSDVLAAGGSRGWLTHAVRTGTVRRLRHEVYCTEATWQRFQRTRAGQHALACRAALHTLAPPAYIALESAAVLHRLPVLVEPQAVHLVRPAGASARRRDGLVIDSVRLPRHHVGAALAVPATTVARTVVDLARRRPLAAALVSGDAALRAHLVDRASLLTVAEDLAGTRGASRVTSAITLMDGRHESPLESRSVAVIALVGLPLPEPQVLIRDGRGRVVARVDFLWRDQGVVGEVDGKIKYVDTGRGASVLWREKRRQEAVEDAGYVVVRWGAAEVAAPPALLRRVRRGFERAARLRGVA